MIWTNKKLKKDARRRLKINLVPAVSVCFLLAVLSDSYPLASTFINQYIPDATNTRVLSDYFTSNAHLVDGLSDFWQNTFLFSRNQLDLSSLRSFDWLINTFTASYYAVFSLFRFIQGLFTHLQAADLAVLVIGTIFAWFYKIFISNLLVIGEKRFFLEQSTYPGTKIRRIFYLFRLRKIFHPAWVMFYKDILQLLWNLTIIGGIIKKYEYYMIPYILAENPSISRKDAFFLSKQLTNGHKWQMFLLQLSFIGWRLLSIATLGLAAIVFVNPYTAVTEAGLYTALRTSYVQSRKKGYELLNDAPLFKRLSEDELLISKALYDDTGGPYSGFYSPLDFPDEYPYFMYSLQPRNVYRPVRMYRIKKNVPALFFCFCLFSITGWAIRNTLSLLQAGLLYTPLYFTGPMSLLYGFCGLLILLVFKGKENRPYLVFGFSLLFYVIAQICLAILVDMNFPISFDSRQYFFSVNEQIYWKGTIIFSLACCAFNYYLAPRWFSFFSSLSGIKKKLITICMLCLLLLSVAGTAGAFLPFLHTLIG